MNRSVAHCMLMTGATKLRELSMGEKPRASAPTSGSLSIEGELLAAQVQRLRAALNHQHEGELSDAVVEALNEVCSEARRRGVLPEHLIIRVKQEIRSFSRFSEEREQVAKHVDLAVTRCIKSYFASTHTSS